MTRILLTLPLPEPAPAMLAAVGEVRVLNHIPPADELATELRGGVDVLCSQLRDHVSADILDAGLPRLRAVCNYAVGYDNIDIQAATDRGIFVTNTPNVLTDATADCTLGLIIAAARRLREGDVVLRAGGYDGWRPDFLLGLDLQDAVLALLGFGRIGQAVARRALAFGMHVRYVDEAHPTPPADLQQCQPVTFAEALRSADVLSIHAPLTHDTFHLVDTAALKAMKPTAVLVNTARGPIVDEDALVQALHSGDIAAAGLDVYENEPRTARGLTELPNVILAPHLGSATRCTRAAMAEICARNATAVLASHKPPHAVNDPTLR